MILKPKIPRNIATAISLTKGEVTKKANVTPRGIPPFTNPMNKGTEEQEQNGVTAPKNDAIKYSNPNRFLLVKKLLIFSIGKNVFTKFMNMETRYNNKRILIVSYKKKSTAIISLELGSNPSQL